MATDTVEDTPATATTWQEALQNWQAALDRANELSRELDVIADAYNALQPDIAEIEPIIRKRLAHHHLRAAALTADLDLAYERFLEGENKVWWGKDHDAIKAQAKADFDAIADWRSRVERAAEVTAYDSLNDAYDKAWDAECDARSILFETPAADAEGAALKLDLLFGPDVMGDDGFCDAWTSKWVFPSIADAKRFMAVVA